MNKMLATTLIVGSAIGATSMAIMSQDKKNQIMKSGKKLVNKATDAMDDMTNMVK